MPVFQHDGIHFHYLDEGVGVPLIFQHGLGGDVNQTREIIGRPAGVRFLSFDARAHGETQPLGDPPKLNFNSFANDALALLDHLELTQAIVGGISMGAGIALNFTLRFPQRVRGLILSRPAWLDAPMPDNLQAYVYAGELLRQHGVEEGQAKFKDSAIYNQYAENSPAVAISLLGQFDSPLAQERAARLELIPKDAPSLDAKSWATINVPVLVIATEQDPPHPLEYAQKLAEAIPNAQLKTITPKSVNAEQHLNEAQAAIGAFLQQFVKA